MKGKRGNGGQKGGDKKEGERGKEMKPFSINLREDFKLKGEAQTPATASAIPKALI